MGRVCRSLLSERGESAQKTRTRWGDQGAGAGFALSQAQRPHLHRRLAGTQPRAGREPDRHRGARPATCLCRALQLACLPCWEPGQPLESAMRPPVCSPTLGARADRIAHDAPSGLPRARSPVRRPRESTMGPRLPPAHKTYRWEPADMAPTSGPRNLFLHAEALAQRSSEPI